jgi:hypothetical protein
MPKAKEYEVVVGFNIKLQEGEEGDFEPGREIEIGEDVEIRYEIGDVITSKMLPKNGAIAHLKAMGAIAEPEAEAEEDADD